MKKLATCFLCVLVFVQLVDAQFRIVNNLEDLEPASIDVNPNSRKSDILTIPSQNLPRIPSSNVLQNTGSKQRNLKRSTACPADTVLFTQAKTTAARPISINNSFSAYAISQYFNAPMELEVSGFQFYGYKPNVSGGVSIQVKCAIYLAGVDSLPMGPALDSVLVTVDTLSNLNLSNQRRIAEFNAPVSINQPFVLVVSNNSPINIALLSNDYSANPADGWGDGLSGVNVSDIWYNGRDINVGAFPLDADWLIEPIVQYDITAGFATDPYCLPWAGASIDFQNTSSPIFFDKMYNQLVFSDDSIRSVWDFGDGSASSDETNPIHVYYELGEFQVSLIDSMTGWTSSCVEDTTGILPYCGVQTQVYCEDFQGVALMSSVSSTVTGGPMTDINYDSLVPYPLVAYFGDRAWIVNEDILVIDTVGVSTSYYSPAGQSDDWMITPSIQLPPGDSIILSWRARTRSSAFPDGYQVYISTTGASYNDLINGTLVFDIAVESQTWQTRSVDLTAFADQPVHIGFRNNTFDGWELYIDDIKIDRPIDFNDLTIESTVEPIDEYTTTTVRQMTDCDFILGAEATNVGADTVANVFARCHFYLNNNPSPFAIVMSDTLPSLAPGESSMLTFSESIAPTAPGLYTLEYIVHTTDFEPNAINDTVTTTVFINSKYMARDDGNVDNTIGVGGIIGKFGQGFELKKDDIVAGLNVYMQSPNPGDFFRIFVYETDTSGMPINLVENSSFMTVDSSFTDSFSFIPFGQLLSLQAGNYLFGVDQSALNSLTIGATSERFTPQVSWAKIDTDPWEPIETSFFSNALMIRPVFEKIDIGITSIENESGRVGFPSELSNAESIVVEITNFDTASLIGFDVNYQINGGSVITEVFPDTLAGMTSVQFTFSQTADLSNPTNDLSVWTSIVGDASLSNDTATSAIYNVTNPIITGSTCYDFEELEVLTIVADTTWAVSGSDYLDFFPQIATGTSRLRTMAGPNYAKNGDRALTLDVNSSGANSLNHLIFNFDLSAFDANLDHLYFSLSLMDHGDEFHATHDKVSIRGSATDPWKDVLIGTAYQTPTSGQYLDFILPISDSLLSAGQNFSSNFQMRIGQMDNFSSNTINVSDGLTVDDLCIFLLDSIDGKINRLVTPLSNICESVLSEICLEIENNGYDTIHSATIKISWPGGSETYPYVGSLPAFEKEIICLPKPMSFNSIGMVNFDFVLQLAGDADTLNNHLSANVNIVPLSNMPLIYGNQFLENYGDSTTLYGVPEVNRTRFWYDSLIDGKLLHIGDTFHTGPVDTMTTYYVSQSPSLFESVGLTDNTIGTGSQYPSFLDGHRFTTTGDVLIKSMKVYPQTAGMVVVNINGAGGSFSHSFNITTPEAGGNVIVLNRYLPAGNDWTIDAAGSTVSRLYRNASGAIYPYSSQNDDFVITGPINALSGFYYFFYDIEILSSCPSERSPITVQKDCPPTLSLFGISTDNQQYKSSGTLESNQLILGGHTVDYSAELEILLTAEFEVELGAEFQAIIDDCGN